MKVRYIILTIYFFYLQSILYGQREAWNWHFGEHVNMNFSTGTPVVSFNSAITAGEGCSTISDTTGNLLMYTLSDTIWNRMHLPMPNGSNLKGCYSATQSALLLRKPGSYSEYYLFNVDCMENFGNNGMNYSVIDMNLDNGLGDVFIKNIPLVTPSSEKLTAVLHRNKRDIWVIGHSAIDDCFYSYLLGPAGLDTTPIITAIGASYNNWSGNPGYMKASPNGRYIACATWMANSKCELFEFNDSTGTFTDYIPLSIAGITTDIYGLEFSFNSKFLYLTSYTSGNSTVSQIDITSFSPATISNSKVVLDTTSVFLYSALQLAPDSHIYVLRSSFNTNLNIYLDRINFPDSGGINCLYERDAVNITNPNTVQGYSLGLPNMLVSLFDSSYRTFIPVIDTSQNTSDNELFENSELFEIYPNPAIHKLELRSSKLIDIQNISIYDLSGNILINHSLADAHSSYCIHIDHLPPGFYFIEIKSEKYVGKQKFLVQ